MGTEQTKTLYLITSYKDKDDKTQNRWRRVGAGFVNSDGSVNLRIDDGMVLMSGHSYQLRAPSSEADGDDPLTRDVRE